MRAVEGDRRVDVVHDVPHLNGSHGSPQSLLLHEWLELVDSAVCHQREEQMTVPDDVRSNIAPLLDDLIVQRTSWALRARQCQRAELDLASACLFPGPTPAITVETSSELSIGSELDGVFRAIVRRQGRIITALELHELPRRAGKPSRRGRSWLLAPGLKHRQSRPCGIKQFEPIASDDQSRRVL